MENWILNADQVAELFGVKRRWIYELVKQGLPQSGKNQFHAPSVVKWFVDNRSNASAADITEQKKLLYKAQTERTELEVAEKRGELLRADVVQSSILELFTGIRTEIESLEPRLARFMPKESVGELRTEIKHILESIARNVETFSDLRDSSKDHPSAS